MSFPPGGVSLVPVSVEVGRSSNQAGALHADQLRSLLQACIAQMTTLRDGYMEVPTSLQSRVQYIRCELSGAVDGDTEEDLTEIAPNQADITIHVYTLSTEEEDMEELQLDGGDDENEAPITAGTSCILPHVRMDKIWENLFYSHHVKSSVLDYATAAMRFALCGVPADVVSCNRLILLHGPPGTGKTSFCKAIAQKLSIRLSGVYPRGKFMEINSHSLFSKWFSESGKLVQKLFEGIRADLDDDPHMLYCILIDEVESIASSRRQGGTDPQDAAGNAVLTQLDRLRRYPNVLVLCTSNLTEMIGLAPTHASQVDLREGATEAEREQDPCHLLMLMLEARYEILRSQVSSLITAPNASVPSVLSNDVGVRLPLPSFKRLRQNKMRRTLTDHHLSDDSQQMEVAQKILRIAEQCELFLTRMRGRAATMTLSQFLTQLPDAIRQERIESAALKTDDDATTSSSRSANQTNPARGSATTNESDGNFIMESVE